MKWVDPETGRNNNDDEFNMTANQTRIGLKITGPDSEDLKLSGLVEVDFYGGGGDNVKHGDLSSALFMPDRKTDVHMDAEGLDFSCVTCHVGEGHEWAGDGYHDGYDKRACYPG